MQETGWEIEPAYPLNAMNEINIRALIADSMVEMERTDTYLSVEESAVLDKYDHIDSRDKSFYKKVMDGTSEYRLRIDYILDQFSKMPVDRMKPVIRAILRMSVYQLIWMDNVPDSAVCNEAVKLASARGLNGLKGYVNGVLRNISRNKDNIRYPSKDKDGIKYLSVMYSCPEWIVKQLSDEYGSGRAEAILASYMEERPLSVRFRIDEGARRQALAGSWSEAGMEVKPNPHLPCGCFLTHTGSVPEMAGYYGGSFIVQDTGSMMVSELAGAHPGDTVMDLCAAPGGKSIHLADIGCRVYSYDISESRCARMIENIRRLDLEDMVTVEVHDATEFIPDMEGRADTVIADVPCSGLGVLGHKSDIRYRLKPSDIGSLTELQRRIIDTAVRYVRPGGRFVYSTCTISRRENEEQAAYIMEKYGFRDITAAALADSAVIPPEGYTRTPDPATGCTDRSDATYAPDTTQDCMDRNDATYATDPAPGLQIFPDTWESDGFYICVLARE